MKAIIEKQQENQIYLASSVRFTPEQAMNCVKIGSNLTHPMFTERSGESFVDSPALQKHWRDGWREAAWDDC